MCGNQFGFDYNSAGDIDKLFSIVIDKIDESFQGYGLSDDDIVWVQLTFRVVDVRLLSEFFIDNNKLDIALPSDKARVVKGINIPLSVDKNSLGSSLHTQVADGYIINIRLKTINDKTFINFLDLIKGKAKFLKSTHKDNITQFDSSFSFYLLKANNSSYVLAVKKVDTDCYTKIRYSLNGVVINNVTDKLIDCNTVIRKYGTNEITIKNNEIVKHKQSILFKSIDKQTVKSFITDDPNIGSIDIETYLNGDDVRIFCLGFKTNLEKDPVIYYIDKDYNSDNLVLNFVDQLLRPKYENVKFYCHNLGGYDVVFLLKILKTFNASCKEIADKYSINCVFRDDKILKITISKKINGINRKFTIRDSYSLLNQSLSSLSKTFQVNTIKGIFPHKFSTRLNLFYTGNTPAITYYDNLTEQQHKSMSTTNWSFKEQAIKYLKDDLNSLFQVVSKANKQVFLDYGVNITDSLTISSLAL